MANNTPIGTDTPDWSGEFLAEVEHRQVAASAGRSAAQTARRHLDLIRDEIDTLDSVMDQLGATPAAPELGLYELINDDDGVDLKAGDLLLCEPYDLDPAKVTVICRLTDGYDPQCNQYRSAVLPIPMITGTDGFHDKFWKARNAMADAQPSGDETEIEYRYQDSFGAWARCTERAAANKRACGLAVQQRVIGGWS
jgi:hypothetical protein